MAFAFPEGLAPEAYPLAWLVGSWRGEGVIAYPGIPETPFVQDVVFDHDGGPYLRYESTLRVLEAEVPETVPEAWTTDDAAEPPAHPSGDQTEPSTEGHLAPGRIWSTETGYWRVSPERPEGLPEDKSAIEVMIADPSGRMTLYLGVVGNGRVDLSSDAMMRTATSAEVTASNRLYGNVQGQLLWVWELAAFGQPLQSYASAKLDRL
ncbi:FABP family protein [Oerskovia sp. NPDC056781]|uniref:FABP family protein n=1 Tax=Oerskovia sp. NPDC056781 TaxID=3345942 RepID=UPI00366ED26D